MFCKKYLLFLLFFSSAVLSAQQLPPIRLEFASYAVTPEGRLIGYFGEKNRVGIKGTGNVSKWVIYSLIATEDRDFYNHHGISYKGLGRAVLKTLTGQTQGGGTITMQLARNLFLTKEKTISRKLTEMSMAEELEKKYSKDQILVMYLNTCYFGRGAYGIWAAAQEFYGKTPDKLSITESAMVVGLLQSPSAFDPEKYPQKALARRNEVLHNLLEVEKITEQQFERYRKAPLALRLRNHRFGAHFLESVRREASAILQSKGLHLDTDQLRIMTTLDYDAQQAAEEAVDAQYKQFSASMKQAQIGLVAVEPLTGKIQAMIGGNPSSDVMGTNHAVQIKRQPGSSFKAFLYGNMIEDGYTLATPLYDAPIVIDKGTSYEWRPENSEGRCTNKYLPLSTSVAHSVNLSAAYAITKLTTPENVAEFAERCGISSPLKPVPSLALGTSEVSPIEMASAFAVFASDGVYSKPYSIVKIEDRHWHTIYYNNGGDNRVVTDSATTYLLTKALTAVVDSGTAKSVRRYYKGAAAGKTGTTQNYTDAWFAGYTPKLSTAIWIGYDDASRKLSGGYQFGGSACAPVWGRMMAGIARHDGHFANAHFIQPENVVSIPVCEETGMPAGDNCRHVTYIPVNSSKLHGICTKHNFPESTGKNIF
jgi:membrane peptidoglycan carboxypeptidase